VRITLESTILVRANQHAKGPARALLLELLDYGHRLIFSTSILEEVERVLHYPRLIKRFALTEVEITQARMAARRGAGWRRYGNAGWRSRRT